MNNCGLCCFPRRGKTCGKAVREFAVQEDVTAKVPMWFAHTGHFIGYTWLQTVANKFADLSILT